MATRFAVKTGNWSDTTLWDNGALPVSGDVIYPNGFTVTIDQDINVASLNNNISNVYIPNIATPAMTSNTQPSGTVISSNNSGTAWYAFNQDAGSTTLYWQSSTANSGWLGYQFGSGKIIKRYFWRTMGTVGFLPKDWTFQGSNDGTTWTTLDTVTGYVTNANYTSGLLANTTSYTYYRINITANNNASFNPAIAEFEMTEATTASPVYGNTTGGTFLIPNTLVGSRNIVQSGAGIVSNSNNGVAQVINIQATSGATVNFNVSGSGFIFNQYWYTASTNVQCVNITGNCTVNFNGDIWGSQQGGSIQNNSGGNIVLQGNATVNINGNIYAAGGHTTSLAPIIQTYTGTSNSAIINITGNLIGTTTGFDANAMIYANSTCTINITGNLTSGLGYCVYSTVGTQVNIPTGTITVNNSSSNSAIYLTSKSSLLTINSPIINKVNANAILASRIRFYSTGNPYWIVQTTTGTDITLAYGAAFGSYPVESDVRFGVSYSASPTRIGTLRVPLPQYVSQGVLVDATVGTAYMDPESFLNAISTSTNPIATRLKNVVTVEASGDQMAAFNV